MEVTLTCTLLNLKEIKIKKGENAGKVFYVGYFFDGESLFKITIPEKKKEEIEKYIGKEIKVLIYVKLESEKLYFKDLM